MARKDGPKERMGEEKARVANLPRQQTWLVMGKHKFHLATNRLGWTRRQGVRDARQGV